MALFLLIFMLYYRRKRVEMDPLSLIIIIALIVIITKIASKIIKLVLIIAIVYYALHLCSPYLIDAAYYLDPIGWGENNIFAAMLLTIGNFFA